MIGPFFSNKRGDIVRPIQTQVFAASFSIVVNAVVSYVFFGFVPDGRFCVGTVAVCCSIVIYSGGGQKKRTILPLNRVEQGGKEEKENLIEDKDS